jgi:anti-anti-sigma factor
MPETLNISLSKIHNNLVVKLPYKEFDDSHVEDYKTLIKYIIHQHTFKTLILDLSEVYLVDKVALGCLVYTWHLCEKQQRFLIMSNSNNHIQTLLEQKGLSSLIETSPTVKEALVTADYNEYLTKKLKIVQKTIELIFGIPFDKYAGWTKEKILILVKELKRQQKSA